MKKRIKIEDVIHVRYHDSLSEALVERIKKLYPIVNEVLPMSLEEWIDGFNYDLHPEPEVEIWEQIVQRCEYEYKLYGVNTKEQKMEIFKKLLAESGATETVMVESEPSA